MLRISVQGLDPAGTYRLKLGIVEILIIQWFLSDHKPDAVEGAELFSLAHCESCRLHQGRFFAHKVAK